MTITLTRSMLRANIVDAYGERLNLGDRALDINLGTACVILDHVPELGPDCLYVQTVEDDGLAMTYWANPISLIRVKR
jgi:hypothetical protein